MHLAYVKALPCLRGEAKEKLGLRGSQWLYRRHVPGLRIRLRPGRYSVQLTDFMADRHDQAQIRKSPAHALRSLAPLPNGYPIRRYRTQADTIKLAADWARTRSAAR